MALLKYTAQVPHSFRARLATPRATASTPPPDTWHQHGKGFRTVPSSRRFLASSSAAFRGLNAAVSVAGGASTTTRLHIDRLKNPIRRNAPCIAAFNKSARRAFHASAVCQRDHHFDTLKFVERLRREGFSEEQAVAMMRILNDVIQESIQNLTRTMVLKEG